MELICANHDCGQSYDAPLYALVANNPRALANLLAFEPDEVASRAAELALEEPFLQQIKRVPRTPEESRASVMQDLLNGAKRVAFTPRIGRK